MKTSGTIKSAAKAVTAFLLVLAVSLVCKADTFTHRKTSRTLHGYAIGKVEENLTAIATQEEGTIKLNLAEWKVTTDRLGRNNKVILLKLDDVIMWEIETAALEKAIVESSYEGPLFILLEIDTPGGRIDLALRICSAITSTNNCPVIAFVKGGQYGGAISAGAAATLACDKVYMASNTTIGSAALVAGNQEMSQVYGRTLTEKINSYWKAYLASLAQQNDRPALLARAMIDEDIEVVEVTGAKKRMFVEPADKKSGHKVVRTWSRKGSLLTLTAEEAVQSGIADKIVESRAQLLADMDAADAEIVTNTAVQEAAKQFKFARTKFYKLRKSLDLKYKQAQGRQSTPRVLKILREVRIDYKTLIRLARRYPDLNINVEALESELNTIEAAYKNIKIGSRQKR